MTLKVTDDIGTPDSSAAFTVIVIPEPSNSLLMAAALATLGVLYGWTKYPVKNGTRKRASI